MQTYWCFLLAAEDVLSRWKIYRGEASRSTITFEQALGYRGPQTERRGWPQDERKHLDELWSNCDGALTCTRTIAATTKTNATAECIWKQSVYRNEGTHQWSRDHITRRVDQRQLKRFMSKQVIGGGATARKSFVTLTLLRSWRLNNEMSDSLIESLQEFLLINVTMCGIMKEVKHARYGRGSKS